MERGARICPRCAALHGAGVERCPHDGRPTLSVDLGADPRIGTSLGGRFTLTGIVGTGAMGAVYRAVQHSMEREVAVKLLRRRYSADESAARRFLREAKGASRLRHPGVVTLLDFGRSEDGELYLAMELLDGRSLRALLGAEGCLDLDRAAPIVLQICDAMDAAHEGGVVHCDLKPENVFLVRGGPSRDGFVKVIDFGIASVRGVGESMAPPGPEGSAAAPSTVWGTPEYMSPEQALGLPLDGRSDVYAIGIVLYEVLTGRTPFQGGRPQDVLDAHVHASPLPPRLIRRDLPEAVEEVVLSALSKDPAARPPTAGELGARLRRAAGGHGRARATIAPAPAEAGPRTNLAPHPATFVGREADAAALDALLSAGHRLVTLHGPAGIGKTRLAIHYAVRCLGDYADAGGAWLCDLSEASSADGICHEVARVLRLLLAVEGSEADQAEQVGRALCARGRILLVLDNFEQVAACAEATVGRWMARAPEARFLVTSRERLRLPGEAVHELGPLSLPRRGEGPEGSEAVRLFVERARAVRPGFALDEQTARVVAEIVRQLDGMPLGIELAAARMGMVSARGLLERLRQRFEVLSDSAARGGGRRSSLRRAIDWSWSLLSPWEQSALAELSVFRGGFALEAAEEVLDLSAFDAAPPVIDVVQALRDKSLLRAYRSPELPGEPRFGLYRSIRDYAAERLAEMGAEPSATRRHGDHYLTTCGAWARGAHGHDGSRLRRKLAAEGGNLVAIHRRALETEPVNGEAAARALGAVLALDPVLSTRGPFRPHLGWLDAAVTAAEAAGVEPALLVRGRIARGEAHRVRMHVAEAEADFERALDLARVAGLRALEGRALFGLGMVTHRQGREAVASPLFEQALEIHRETGDREAEGRTTAMLGVKLLWVGRLAEARAYLEAALAVLQQTGDRWYEGFVRGCLAWLLQEAGDLAEARSTYARALSTLREVGAARYEALFLRALGCLDWEEGRLDEARARVERALSMATLTGDHWLETHYRANLAAIDATLGSLAEARAGLELAERGASEAGTAWLESVVGLFGGHVLLALAREGEDEAEPLLAEVDRRLAAAEEPGMPDGDNPAGTPPLVERSDEVRFARRMLRRARER